MPVKLIDEVIHDQHIVLDGAVIEGCSLINCTLIFHGLEPFTMSHCNVENAIVRLDGPALRGLEFVRFCFDGLSPQFAAAAVRFIRHEEIS